MLGQLYKPRGLALEQAQVVLECNEPLACNVAWGCSNGCLYCYGPSVGRQSRESWKIVRQPKTEPALLVERQLKSLIPQGVFISFMTDPFLPINRERTENLIALLLKHGVKVATSSKIDVSRHKGVRHGMTIISLNENFYKVWERNAPPPRVRIERLKTAHGRGDFTWVSIEPCPPPAIFKQDITEVLKAISFVDLIVKGRWQYDKRARTEEARQAYIEIFNQVAEFCKQHGISFHPKSETLNFLAKL